MDCDKKNARAVIHRAKVEGEIAAPVGVCKDFEGNVEGKLYRTFSKDLDSLAKYDCEKNLLETDKIALSHFLEKLSVQISLLFSILFLFPKSFPKYLGEKLSILPLTILAFCAIASPAQAKRAPLVIIDAGHGGSDKGSHKISYVYEKFFTLDVSRRLNRYLSSKGYKTKMMRSNDYFISVRERARRANKNHNSIFISIHFNEARNRSARGIETYWYRSGSYSLASYVHRYALSNTRSNNRGIKRNSFVVISKTNMPACLVEGGFLTNSSERKKLYKAKNRQRLAEGIGKGIISYIKKYY